MQKLRKIIHYFLIASFLIFPQSSFAASELNQPLIFTGFRQDHFDPLRMNFFFKGNVLLPELAQNQEYQRMLEYFLTALTVPTSKFWVNLSPYEAHRLMPKELEGTLVGRDLLAQDFLLKKLTAHLMDPALPHMKTFWEGVSQQDQQLISKVWIVPATATVEWQGQQVRIVSSRLKVQTNIDYLALSKEGKVIANDNDVNEKMKRYILPQLEKEVNEGKQFIVLRRIYHALILATWYKKHMRPCGVMADFVDSYKTEGVFDLPRNNYQKIYRKYVMSYHQGFINRIEERNDASTHKRYIYKSVVGGLNVDPALTYQEIVVKQNTPRSIAVQFNPILRQEQAMNVFRPKTTIPGSEGDKFIAELNSLINKINNHPFGRLAPFVWNHHEVNPFEFSAFGGNQLLREMRDWLNNSQLLKERFVVPAFSNSVIVGDDDLEKMATFFVSQQWLSESESQLLIQTFAKRPAFIKSLVPQDIYSPDITPQKLAKQFMDNKDPRLVQDMPEDIKKNPDEEFKYRLIQAQLLADDEILKYSQVLETTFDLMMKALMRMVPAEFAETIVPINEMLEMQTMTKGFVLDAYLRVRTPSPENPIKMIRWKNLDSYQQLKANPSLALNIFEEALKRDAVIDIEMMDVIKEIFKGQVKLNPAAYAAFRRICETKKPIAAVLAAMLRADVLPKIFPVFYHQDMFLVSSKHLFPLSWHSLYLFHAIERVLYSEEEGDQRIKTMYQELLGGDEGDLLAFRLTMLLHDMFKEADHVDFMIPHNIGGANTNVPLLLKPMNLSTGIIRRVQWLVYYHQTLPSYAFLNKFRETIYSGDYLTFLDFSNGILTKGMMEQLILMTYADGSSTQPFKEGYDEQALRLIFQIYDGLLPWLNEQNPRVRRLIEHGWRIQALRDQGAILAIKGEQFKSQSVSRLQSSLNDLRLSPQAIESIKKPLTEVINNPERRIDIFREYTTLFPFSRIRQVDSYTMNLEILTIAALREIKKISSALSVEAFSNKIKIEGYNYYELFVGITEDRPGLIREISGVLAALGFNILSAKINTTTDGLVLDVIQGYFIKHPDFKLLVSQLNDRLKLSEPLSYDPQLLLPQLVRAVILGKIKLEEIYEQGNIEKIFYRMDKTNKYKTRISFEDVALADGLNATKMILNTPDRLGLIFIVSSIIKKMGFNIETAEPKTPQRLTLDFFQLTALDEHQKPRPLNKDEKEQLSKFLIDVLDQPSVAAENMLGSSKDLGGIDLTLGWQDEVQSCTEENSSKSVLMGMQVQLL